MAYSNRKDPRATPDVGFVWSKQLNNRRDIGEILAHAAKVTPYEVATAFSFVVRTQELEFPWVPLFRLCPSGTVACGAMARCWVERLIID